MNTDRIAFTYYKGTKKEPATMLEPPLCGHLDRVIIWGLLKAPTQYDASGLKASMTGLDADEDSH